MSAPIRFALPSGTVQPGKLRLGAAVARHAQVMRLRPGAKLILFDGSGEEYDALLLALGPGEIQVQVGPPRAGAGESPLAVHLVQAIPVKLPRFDIVVRMCTELGVRSIRPLIAAHGQLPGGGVDVVIRRLRRWRRIARSAAQQCGRSVVPEVREPRMPSELDWAAMQHPMLLLESEAAPPLGPGLVHGAVASVSLLVGPEGGWADHERDLAMLHGAVATSLGPRTLRSDSAAAVAITLLQAIRGDLR